MKHIPTVLRVRPDRHSWRYWLLWLLMLTGFAAVLIGASIESFRITLPGLVVWLLLVGVMYWNIFEDDHEYKFKQRVWQCECEPLRLYTLSPEDARALYAHMEKNPTHQVHAVRYNAHAKEVCF